MDYFTFAPLKMRGLVYIIAIGVLFSSCGKKLRYFQEKEEAFNTYDKINIYPAPAPDDHVVTNGDVLTINLNTPDPNTRKLFYEQTLNEETTNTPKGFVVNEQGYLFLPVLGKIKASGQSLIALEQNLKDSFSTYLKQFDLSLRLSGFRFTALGAFKRPGIQYVQSDQITLPEALGLAGDLADFGEPREVKIVRNEEGIKKTYIVDLTGLDFFNSPVYYVQSNDIIYVSTLGRKVAKENLQYLTLFATLINTFAIVYWRLGN